MPHKMTFDGFDVFDVLCFMLDNILCHYYFMVILFVMLSFVVHQCIRLSLVLRLLYCQTVEIMDDA